MSRPMPPPPFRYYLRVRYHECDAQRVVFNGHYGTYVDMACTEFLNQIMPDRHQRSEAPVQIQLVKQVIEWTAPARFDDIVEIATWCPSAGNTSFVLKFELRKAGETKPFVTAETTNVHMDGRNWTKQPIPPDLKALLLRGAPGVVVDHAGHLAGRKASG